MEIGDNHINYFKLIAGGDKNIGFAGKGVQHAVVIGGAFKQTD